MDHFSDICKSLRAPYDASVYYEALEDKWRNDDTKGITLNRNAVLPIRYENSSNSSKILGTMKIPALFVTSKSEVICVAELKVKKAPLKTTDLDLLKCAVEQISKTQENRPLAILIRIYCGEMDGLILRLDGSVEESYGH
jgi:hypothetical protein